VVKGYAFQLPGVQGQDGRHQQKQYDGYSSPSNMLDYSQDLKMPGIFSASCLSPVYQEIYGLVSTPPHTVTFGERDNNEMNRYGHLHQWCINKFSKFLVCTGICESNTLNNSKTC